MMKRILLLLSLSILSGQALCQQKGHFLLEGGPSVIIGSGTKESPSTLFYAIEAGISYDILESLRLTGTIGGFRSVMTITGNGWRADTSNGALFRLGAQYLFLKEERAVRPSVSLSAGYRLRIPPEALSPGQVPSPGRADGPFLSAGLGADLRIGGLRVGVALTAELTATLRPAAGLRLTALLP